MPPWRDIQYLILPKRYWESILFEDVGPWVTLQFRQCSMVVSMLQGTLLGEIFSKLKGASIENLFRHHCLHLLDPI